MKSPDTPAVKKIHSYHTEQWRQVYKYMKKVSKNPDEKSIHKARVSVKKLVSLFNFIDYLCHEDQGKHNLKRLLKVFKLMGAIRDHTNTDKLCEKFKIEKSTFDYELPELHIATHKLKTKSKKCGLGLRHIKKAAGKKLELSDTPILAAYIRAKWLGIIKNISSDLTTEELHALRKDIKDLIYTAPLCTMTSRIIRKKELDSISKLQTLIGEWHDIIVFRDKLIDIQFDLMHKAQLTAIKKEEKRRIGEINLLRASVHRGVIAKGKGPVKRGVRRS